MWSFLKEIFIAIKELIMWGYKRKKTLKEDLESSEKVLLILQKMIAEYECDRALVYQFHNGEYFYTGNSIDKMSNTHEAVSKGVSKEQVNAINIFTSLYRHLMRNLLNEDVVVYSNIDDVEDFNTKVFFSERGVNSAVMTIMRDRSDRPVGILCMEYVKGFEPGIESTDQSIVQAGQSIYDLLVYGRIKK